MIPLKKTLVTTILSIPLVTMLNIIAHYLFIQYEITDIVVMSTIFAIISVILVAVVYHLPFIKVDDDLVYFERSRKK